MSNTEKFNAGVTPSAAEQQIADLTRERKDYRMEANIQRERNRELDEAHKRLKRENAELGTQIVIGEENERTLRQRLAVLEAREEALRTALKRLADDVNGAWAVGEWGIREAIGNTNYSVVAQRVVEARALLAPSSPADKEQP